MIPVRAFNERGLQRFGAYLAELRQDPSLGPPDFWADQAYTRTVEGAAVVEARSFATKYDFGQHACTALRSIPTHVLRSDAELWIWLACFYFSELCPVNGKGHRKPLRSEKYMASATDIRSGLDKHLLFFPWKLIAIHGDSVKWLLGGELGEDTRFLRELANSYRRNVSREYMSLARRLYYDGARDGVKYGATSISRRGNMRRLNDVMHQLDLTYDIFGLPAKRLCDLLPSREFELWKPEPPQAQVT